MKVIKRDGHMVEYSREKIENAILKANKDVIDEEKASSIQIRNIIKYIEGLGKKRILVEDIQDIIEIKLMSIGKFALAKKYITYRYTRELVRKGNTTDIAIKSLIDNDSMGDQNINKNAKSVNIQRDYLASITSTDITRRFLLPEDIVRAHDEGIIYFHNTDYFAQNALCNSSIINLEEMLQNGCVINEIYLERPKTFKEAINITIQIIRSVLSNQYGGITISLSHLSSFVVDSYKRYLKKYKNKNITQDLVTEYATADLKEEISDGIKTLLYGISTLTLNDSQSQSIDIYMYLSEKPEYKKEQAQLIEETLKITTNNFKDKDGTSNISPVPKLIYVLEEDTINEDSEYYYLTQLAMKCITKKMTPELVSEKVMRELNDIDKCYPCLDGGIYLLPYYDNNEIKYYGRFNQGIVTLNLVDIALSSDKDVDLFWKLLDERLELCHRALQIKHKRLSKITASSSPILWRDGAISKIADSETIHDLLHSGYSTISLGFTGLHECVKYMKSNPFYEEEDAYLFSTKIIDKLNLKCKKWSDIEKITYTLSGTTNERVCNKFAECLKDRYGIIKGITDKSYITSSHHIPSSTEIDIYKKLSVESNLQKLIPGGSPMSIELGYLSEKEDSLKDLLKYIYENILYIQINCKKDKCLQCGYEGVLELTKELIWKCPKCENKDEDKLKIFRRFHGKVLKDNWTSIQKEEIKQQKVYLSKELKVIKNEY